MIRPHRAAQHPVTGDWNRLPQLSEIRESS
jgi:hypothetical protein